MAASELPVKDDLILRAILRGESQAEAAAASGLSERSVRRHISDPAFKAALRSARDDSVRRTSDALADGAARAVATLSALMDDSSAPPAVRRAAARDLIQLSHRIRDQVDVIERLEELEMALKGGDDQ